MLMHSKAISFHEFDQRSMDLSLFCLLYPNQYHYFCPSSPPVITFVPISEYLYKLIRFLLNSSMVKSDNEIGKNNDKKYMI